MSDTLNQALQALVEHAALEAAVIKYCTAVDRLDDVADMLTNFTEDAVLDLSGLGLPRFVGHAEIGGFYAQVFADMSHHGHLVSNFRVESLAGDSAEVRCYVTGLGRSKAGVDIVVYVWYELGYRKVDGVWKMHFFAEGPLVPMPDSVTQVHKKD